VQQFFTSEQLIGAFIVVGNEWLEIVEPNGMFKCKGPHLSSDDFGPSSHGMEDHGVCTIRDNANVMLNNSILPMCANSTEGVMLTADIKMFCKFCGCENSVIRMNMHNANVVSGGKSFAGLFQMNSLLGIGMFL